MCGGQAGWIAHLQAGGSFLGKLEVSAAGWDARARAGRAVRSAIASRVAKRLGLGAIPATGAVKLGHADSSRASAIEKPHNALPWNSGRFPFKRCADLKFSSFILGATIVARRLIVREASAPAAGLIVREALLSPSVVRERPGPSRLRFRVGRLQRLPGLEKEPRSRMCPSPGSRFRPWSARRLPTSCLVQNDSRVPICAACSNAIRRFGKQGRLRASSGTASRRGDTGGSPTFKRGSFLLADCRWDAAAPMLSEAPSRLRV